MRLAVIESPFKTTAFELEDALVVVREETNVAYARALAHHCITQLDLAPWASHLLYTQPGILRDDDPAERTLGITAGLLWSAHADVCVVGVDRGITAGMRDYGIPRAEELGIPVQRVRLGGEWEVPQLLTDELVPMLATACLPSVIPPHLVTPARVEAWRMIEERARGTLLVHGQHAEVYTATADKIHGGYTDPSSLLEQMVTHGVLRPCKADFGGSSATARTEAAGYYGTGTHAEKYVRSQPWSAAHAKLWSYEPVNRTPMRNKPCVVC